MHRRAVLGGAAVAAAGAAGWFGWQRLTARRPDHADLAYGSDARQVLDVYLPEGAGPFPFVMEIHGGAFRMGSKTMAPVADSLLEAGIAVVRPNYRLSGTDPWPAQGQDCGAALAFARQEAAGLGLDPAAFALWGQSAGAFLAVSTALDRIEAGDPPRAVAAFYGPFDFGAMDADLAALGRTPTMGATDAGDSPESQLLGFAVGERRAEARAMGPVGRLERMGARALPPLFLRHGDADPMIAHLQSERLAAAWAAVDPGAGVDLALVPGAGHGTAEFDTEAVMGPLRDFLSRALVSRALVG